MAACSGDRGDAGATTVSFALPNGWIVDLVTYQVLSSDGGTLVSGTAKVSDPRANLSLSLELPTGGGDTLQLVATTADGTSCGGTSPPFDVVAGHPTFVTLVLDCGGVTQGADSCPLVSVAAPTPAEAIVPSGEIAIAATASDSDPGDALTFAWASVAGTFDDPTAASTRYVCNMAGAETLVLTVNDHHLPSSCTMTVLVPVTCLPSGEAVCGDGVVEPGESCDPPDGTKCSADCQSLTGG